MRFFADAMVGRLAKWLRILGCDVAYAPEISDREIAERGRREGRVILTRDTLLIRRREPRNREIPDGRTAIADVTGFSVRRAVDGYC